MPPFADNLRRLMARDGLTLRDVVERTGLDERTLKSMLRGDGTRPHARTLHQLAQGLEVSVDELFASPGLLAQRSFDRRTNPLVDAVVAEHPQWFDGWLVEDFDELYSHFGAGGALTAEGAAEQAQRINRKRQVMSKVAILLESSHAELLSRMIDVLYDQVAVQ